MGVVDVGGHLHGTVRQGRGIGDLTEAQQRGGLDPQGAVTVGVGSRGPPPQLRRLPPVLLQQIRVGRAGQEVRVVGLLREVRSEQPERRVGSPELKQVLGARDGRVGTRHTGGHSLRFFFM